MCGICGELRFDARRPQRSRVLAMAAQLARRGPDHEGFFSHGPVALGHRRLAVLDLSPRSDQPLWDPHTDLTIVFNGSIYNYRVLRHELMACGHQFESSGDTEVVLKAYAQWGEACVDHLDGMFAFAVHDPARDGLFLARDRFGIKPLYYCTSRNSFRFASNTQALLAGGDIDTDVDPVALHHHLTLHGVVPAPRTLLRGVRKLGPAQSMFVDTGGAVSAKDYWRLTPAMPDRPLSKWEWCEQVYEVLARAVAKRRDVADVPVGVLLSGGLDSSLLVALLAEQGGGDLNTYSIGFDDVGGETGNEFARSDLVAQHFATRHHRFSIGNDEVLQRLPEAVAHMSEPMVSQDAIGFYLLAERVSADLKVVQSGQGADEVFGGYFWYPRMQATQGSDLERFAGHYFDRDHEEYLDTVTAAYRGADHSSQLMRERLEAAPGGDFLNRVLAVDVSMLLVDDPVKRVDNMTMAWGLEARVPYLDRELVELAAAMPAELKIGQGGKQPLKVIARGLLPDALVDVPKQYFPVPALKYVRGPFLHCMREVLMSDACRRRGLFDRDYIARLLREPDSHLTRLNGSKLWHLALLEHWLQANVDSACLAKPMENQTFLAACK